MSGATAIIMWLVVFAACFAATMTLFDAIRDRDKWADAAAWLVLAAVAIAARAVLSA